MPIAGGGGEKWPIHFYWSYLVMREGGQKVSMPPRGRGRRLHTIRIIKAGEQLAELGKLEPFQPGYLGATWPQALGVFGDGKAAMILGFENTEANQRKPMPATARALPRTISAVSPSRRRRRRGQGTDTLGGLNGWAVTKKAPTETDRIPRTT